MEDRAKKLAIQLDDGRVVVGIPKPEDQGRLDQLDQEIVLLTAGDYDTAGHGYSDEIALDVEGHAITLRLPTPADAEALRKALAVGAVTATIVAAGAIASLQGSPAAPAPAAPIAAPAPAMQPATQAEQDRDLGIMDVGAPAAPAAPSQATQAEQDRDLGIMDVGAPAAPAAPAADPAAFREERLAERDPLWGVQVSGPSDSAAAPSEGETPGTHGPGRGELERNP
jgi:hypothetical protein